MLKTKLEEYLLANGLRCEIEIYEGEAYCCLYKKGDLYIKMHKAKTVNIAIEMAVNTHREKFLNGNKISKQDIQDQKRARMFHKRFSDKK